MKFLKCIFCNKTRYFFHDDYIWSSVFILDIHGEKIKFTICPNCRYHNINEIYKKLTQSFIKQVINK